MSDATPSGNAPVKLSPVEKIKAASDYLRGQIADELLDQEDGFGKDSIQLLKHHGTYQQDDRDLRNQMREQGLKGKALSMMVRTRIPGGRLTADQFLAEMDLGDELGNGTMRLTTRQAIQHHGIPKGSLQALIRRINEIQLSTLAACGDVNRNVMCCPAPFTSPVYRELHEMTDRLVAHLEPQSKAYFEIWLQDPESGEKSLVGGATEADVIEPIYGKTYLPRKFKTGIALPHDNCIDIYTQDLGFLAVVQDDHVVGYNVLVGGGMGTTPANKKTYPALAKRMAYISPEQVLDVAEAVVKVQRDHGNREDRKVARMKYLVDRWGIERFKSMVEEYYGHSLENPHEADVFEHDDHMGWGEQGDGKWFYGLNIENGRVYDNGQVQLKAALREVCHSLQPELRLTAHQSLLITNLEESAKSELTKILQKHGAKATEEYSSVRRWSIACVAWPTCSLAITESERALPGVMDEFEPMLEELGLQDEKFTVRMTGCPNGCARPYNADIGLVGKAKDRYTVFLGGCRLGKRLGFIYKDLVGRDELLGLLRPVFELFKNERERDESFGDFCARQGFEGLSAKLNTESEPASDEA
jgi:sulfite reductase (ferredoxin)